MVVLVVVRYKTQTYTLTLQEGDPIESIFSCIGEVVDLEGHHCILLLNGKKYVSGGPGSNNLLPTGKTTTITSLLLSVSFEEIDRIKQFKSDPLVKGVAQEELDELRRAQRTQQLEHENPWGEKIVQDKEYRFNNLEVLFRRADPPPFVAEKLLKKLSLDPGIVHIMKTRRFTVGCLCEIDPVDTDEEQAEIVEGPDKCLLGWNRNFGQRIALRLRTNDLKSFRNYGSIVNTLIHELTHNVFGPHDEKFWKLFNELNHEYDNIHRARGYSTGAPIQASVTAAPTSGKIGGSRILSPTSEQLREARIRALENPNKPNS